MITYTNAELYTASSSVSSAPNGKNKVLYMPSSTVSPLLGLLLYTGSNYELKEIFGSAPAALVQYVQELQLVSMNLTFGSVTSVSGNPLVLWT